MQKLTLKSDSPQSINVSQMEDGQLAVITNWQAKEQIGLIVQRYNQALIVLGKDVDFSFSSIFANNRFRENCEVRILTKGDCIVIE